LEASEVQLSGLQMFIFADINATAPQGVGTLDIVYEVRTGADAYEEKAAPADLVHA